jgi:hypothetical protein
MLRAKDTTKRFSKGERVALTYSEILQSFLTLMQFGMLMTAELQKIAATNAVGGTGNKPGDIGKKA